MKQFLSKIKLMTTNLLIATMLVSLLSIFTLASPASADYWEECYHEGCSSGEISELKSSYTEECTNEGCEGGEAYYIGFDTSFDQPSINSAKAVEVLRKMLEDFGFDRNKASNLASHYRTETMSENL